MFRLLTSVMTLVFLCGTANAEIVLEIGPNAVSHRITDSVTVILQKRWQGKWIVGLGYVSPHSLDTCGRPECRWEISDQAMIGVERLFTWRRLSAGVGLYHTHHLDLISSAYLNVRLSLEFAVTKRIAVKFGHLSNNQSGEVITICNEVTCLTDDFNPGLDSLLLVWHF